MHSLPAFTPPSSPTSVRELYAQVWLHAHGARARLVAALAMLGGSQLLKLALPWMAAQAIDTLQSGGRAGLPRAGAWIAAMLALHVGVWLLHGPARVLERGVALRVRRSVADALYQRLAQAPLAWHERHHSGDLQHRVGQASAALYGFTQSQFMYLQNAIHLIGPLVALWLLSRLTGGIALAGVLLIGTLVLRFDRALMRLAERENQAERRYAARLLDFVGNISAIASLRLQQATRRLLDARLVAAFVPLSRIIVLTEWKWCAVDLLTIGLGWALVVAYALSAGGAAAGGTVLIGSLFMVYQYAQQAGGVLCSMAANFQGLAQTQAGYASGGAIRTAPPPATPRTPPPSGWRELALHDITYTHAGAEGRGGIDGVTLTLRRGERIALVGPSGSGKSTLLRVLAGLYDATRGSLSVDGRHEIGRRHAGELATLIPQEAEIFEASVRDNLTFGEPVAAAELHRAVVASALDEVLAGLPLGLDTPLSERGFNLSGGQRQRLALARGVLAARGSSLLLLDEPTSALDPLIERHVHQRIDAAFAGACIVASVHRLGLLDHFDRVVFMTDGRIVDVGHADELERRQPVFAAMRRSAGTRLATAAVQPGLRRATHETGRTMISDNSPLGSSDDASDDFDGSDDAITLLTADHEEVRQLFTRYDELVSDGAADTQRADLARQICDALTAHATIEEELFYPAARDALGDDELVDTALAEHASAKDLIAQIEGMEASDDLFDATVRMLQEAIEHHVEEEEDELFPQVQDSGIDLLALGEQLAERKDEVLAELQDDGA